MLATIYRKTKHLLSALTDKRFLLTVLEVHMVSLSMFALGSMNTTLYLLSNEVVNTAGLANSLIVVTFCFSVFYLEYCLMRTRNKFRILQNLLDSGAHKISSECSKFLETRSETDKWFIFDDIRTMGGSFATHLAETWFKGDGKNKHLIEINFYDHIIKKHDTQEALNRSWARNNYNPNDPENQENEKTATIHINL